MNVKTKIQIFKSWEVPIDANLELDIFSTTEQTLQIHTYLKRNLYENGVLYSAALLAKSDVSVYMNIIIIICKFI